VKLDPDAVPGTEPRYVLLVPPLRLPTVVLLGLEPELGQDLGGDALLVAEAGPSRHTRLGRWSCTAIPSATVP
jgi:hypothetical protein